MGKIGRMEAQLNKMSVMVEKFLKGGKKQDPENNGAGSVGSISIDNPGVKALFEAFVQALQSQGYISARPLSQRNAANGDAAPTLDERSASVGGPVTVLYGLRKLKEKITAANFVIERLPRFSAVAGVAGQRINGNAARDSWNARDAAGIRRQYEKLSEVVKELKSLMSPLTLQI